jgi:hypothetical protein
MSLHAHEIAAAQSHGTSVPRSNVLRYSIVRQQLWGTVNGKGFGPVQAESGGGQDGVHARAITFSQWRPDTATNKGRRERGGAIVPGWWIVLPERLAKGAHSSAVCFGRAPTNDSLRILPYQLAPEYAGSTRDSFYIHGTGGPGSDGCLLVPPGPRKQLVDLVCSGNGAWLHVYLSGVELEQLRRENTRLRNIA